MKTKYRQWFLGISFVALASITLAQPSELRGTVVGVSDGDTVTVLDGDRQQHKVRLNGVDAPESAQDFGQESKRNLSALVFGKDVVVKWSKRDKYGRVIGTVLIGATNANLEQLKAGLAWYYRQYERDVPPENRQAYAKAEVEARQTKRGLWSERIRNRRGNIGTKARGRRRRHQRHLYNHPAKSLATKIPRFIICLRARTTRELPRRTACISTLRRKRNTRDFGRRRTALSFQR